jgi:O-acetyl-ADP-ribose deacetylase (regulator of RNase III)/tRNA A-37 threonylcarbamoyl transferase component Bud32
MPSDSQTVYLADARPPDPGPPAHPHYEVFTPPVGAGGMGVVYRGRHRGLDKLFALKVTRPGVAVARVAREARLLARVSSPHVVAVHGFEPLADGRHLLVMDWVDGPDLGRVLDAGGPVPEGRAVGWMRQVAEGMRAAADEGITHRDLKPSNILLDGRDAARVADFGLARGPAVGPELTAHVALLGTAYYMAPEQAESPAAADTRADVYGFGATFYHLLTGRPPFDAETTFGVLFKHRTEPLAAPQAHNPALSDRTAAILERCLAKKPADRFQTFDDLLRHLHPDATATAWADGEPDGPWRRFRDRRAVYLDPAARAALADAPDVYPFADGRTLTVTAGDITQQPRADVIVSPDNELLSMSRGVAKAVRVAAGSDRMRAEVRKYPPVRAGGVVVTAAGALPARFVFHAVTVAALNARVPPSRDLLAEILHGCVHLSDMLGLSSLALSLLGTGGGTFPPDVCLDTLFRFWSRTLSRGATALRDVRVVLHLRERKPRPVPEWAEQGG